jgi:hypothetical protein
MKGKRIEHLLDIVVQSAVRKEEFGKCQDDLDANDFVSMHASNYFDRRFYLALQNIA